MILPAPLLAMGTPIEYMGSHTVCIRSGFNVLEGGRAEAGGVGTLSNFENRSSEALEAPPRRPTPSIDSIEMSHSKRTIIRDIRGDREK